MYYFVVINKGNMSKNSTNFANVFSTINEEPIDEHLSPLLFVDWYFLVDNKKICKNLGRTFSFIKLAQEIHHFSYQILAKCLNIKKEIENFR